MWSLKCHTQELQFNSKGETELELVLDSYLADTFRKSRGKSKEYPYSKDIFIYTEDEVKQSTVPLTSHFKTPRSAP